MEDEFVKKIHRPLTAAQEERAQYLYEWSRPFEDDASLERCRQAVLAHDLQVEAVKATGIDPHKIMAQAIDRLRDGSMTIDEFGDLSRQLLPRPAKLH